MRFLVAVAAAVLSAASACGADNPLFRDYPAPQIEDTSVPVDLASPEAFLYRTRLRAAAAGPINFAGRYKLAVWPCGAQCESGAMVDAVTGQAIFLPFNVCCEDWPTDRDFNRILFRKSSRLIVFSGQLSGDGVKGVHFFEFANGQFRRLATRVPANSEAQLQLERDRLKQTERKMLEMKEAAERARQAEADRRKAEDEAELKRLQLQQEKVKRLENAEGVFRIAKDGLYECTDRELPKLVKSGEAASVLASAALTFCETPFQNARRSFRSLLEARADGAIETADDDEINTRLKATLIETVTASAVRMKADNR